MLCDWVAMALHDSRWGKRPLEQRAWLVLGIAVVLDLYAHRRVCFLRVHKSKTSSFKLQGPEPRGRTDGLKMSFVLLREGRKLYGKRGDVSKRQAFPRLASFFRHGDVGGMDVRGGRTISAPVLLKRSALY
jgi:hypothetical protein